MTRRNNILWTVEGYTSRQRSAATGLCVQHSSQSETGIQSWHVYVSKEIQLHLEDMGFPGRLHA